MFCWHDWESVRGGIVRYGWLGHKKVFDRVCLKCGKCDNSLIRYEKRVAKKLRDNKLRSDLAKKLFKECI